MDYGRQFTDIAVNQVGYHLFDRRMQKRILPYCLEHNIASWPTGRWRSGC